MRLPANLSGMLFALGAAVLVSACDEGGTPDAGPNQASLVVLDPPGDSIGLATSESALLRVQYVGPDGVAIRNAGVNFELVSGPSEDVAGSTLSASVAGTGADGIAAITVRGGPNEGSFRVRASAPGARPALFYVVISNSGFAAFDVIATHIGPRRAADYTNIELRLYQPQALTCSQLDIDELPDSVLPPRTTSSFGASVKFRNLAAARGYTLVAYGEAIAGGARLGFGCVEMTAEQIVPDVLLTALSPVKDRALRWPTPVTVVSAIALPELVDELDAIVAPDPWRTLVCDLGAAQLVIDCVLDAAVSDGTLDCEVNGQGALVDDVMALRGSVDAAGCRSDERSPGVASLDRDLLDTMTVGPFTEASAVALAEARDQLVSGLSLESALAMLGDGVAEHAIDSLRLASGTVVYQEILTPSARPIVRVDAVAADIVGSQLTLAAHGFTLDLEQSFAAAFDDQLLAAHGLAGRGSDLGVALSASFGGCASISTAVCTRVGRAANCLNAACAAARTAQNVRLRAWIGASARAGLDFSLEGTATIEDRDFDLAADTIGDGAAQPLGSWTVRLETSANPVEGAGAFGGP